MKSLPDEFNSEKVINKLVDEINNYLLIDTYKHIPDLAKDIIPKSVSTKVRQAIDLGNYSALDNEDGI